MYKYTNGEILDEECFVSQFFKVTEKINPENYKDEVEDGLYKDTEIAVTKETQQLKFRYKDPDGQLIEQENVPVVIDGTGIKAITDYWAVSQTDVKPALSLFTPVLKNPDSVNRYLWKFSVIEYTDGTTDGSYEDASIVGVHGVDGTDGTSAKYVEIDTSEGVAFVNGSPSKITLRAICTGFTPSSYKWFKNGTELTGKTQSYLEVTTEGVYKVEVNGQYEDTQSVVAVKDGEDAYTVVIDNENIHVPTNNTGYTTSELSYYVEVDVYRGAKKLNNIKAYTELGDDDFYVRLSVGDNAITSVVADRTQAGKKVYNTFKITIPENTYMYSSISITVDAWAKNTVAMRKCGQLVPAKAGAKGDKGDEGEQGERGAEYLGCFARNDLAYDSREGNLVADDFYLNSTDGYIYVAIKSSSGNAVSWGRVSSYSDPRYKQAMNDMIAIAGSDRSEGFMSVVNLWVKNLTAQTALIQNLFAKVMKMENGGIFKSDNYDGTITETKDAQGNVTDRNITSYGTQGFAMDSHGKIDIVDMNATNITIDEMNIGRKNGNTVFGKWALNVNNASVTQNIAIGDNAMVRCNHSEDDDNIAIGTASLRNNKGFQNIAIGSGAIANANNTTWATEGDYNIGIGFNTLKNCTSNTGGTRCANNIAIGKEAGLGITTGWNNICIGEYSKVYGDREANHQININNNILYKKNEISETYAELYSYFSQALSSGYFGCTGIFNERCVAYGYFDVSSKTFALYSPTGSSIATIAKGDATVINFNYYIMIVKS